ncbi:pre-rRNA-processing protein TSR2 homolog [Pezoporus occidentalis]|uniref:pre-rRNA-processing protein TSR2 homolog n=1 Tax=Pezoporus occidentalis TaxID=407982 RepID=UPI002F912C10
MAAPSAEERALLERGVRAVLSGWAALQLAVAQGFGGPQSPEKAAWLVGAVLEFLSQNPELAEDEVEDFLAEVMDNEFDTAVEDGSLQQVSRELLSVFARVREGDVGGVGEALAALARRGPALASALANARPGHAPDPAPAPQSTGTSSEEEEEEAMECGTPPAPPDGWTLVRRRRR